MGPTWVLSAPDCPVLAPWTLLTGLFMSKRYFGMFNLNWVSEGYLLLHQLPGFLSDFHQIMALQWRHNGCDGVSNHQPHDCLLNRLFRPKSKKTSKLRVTGLCVGNSPVASIAENVSIWWRHHGTASSRPRKHDMIWWKFAYWYHFNKWVTTINRYLNKW